MLTGAALGISDIIVVENMCRQGIGRELMTRLENYADAKKMGLLVVIPKEYLPFYQKCGFQEFAFPNMPESRTLCVAWRPQQGDFHRYPVQK